MYNNIVYLSTGNVWKASNFYITIHNLYYENSEVVQITCLYLVWHGIHLLEMAKIYENDKNLQRPDSGKQYKAVIAEIYYKNNLK